MGRDELNQSQLELDDLDLLAVHVEATFRNCGLDVQAHRPNETPSLFLSPPMLAFEITKRHEQGRLITYEDEEPGENWTLHPGHLNYDYAKLIFLSERIIATIYWAYDYLAERLFDGPWSDENLREAMDLISRAMGSRWSF